MKNFTTWTLTNWIVDWIFLRNLLSGIWNWKILNSWIDQIRSCRCENDILENVWNDEKRKFTKEFFETNEKSFKTEKKLEKKTRKKTKSYTFLIESCHEMMMGSKSRTIEYEQKSQFNKWIFHDLNFRDNSANSNKFHKSTTDFFDYVTSKFFSISV